MRSCHLEPWLTSFGSQFGQLTAYAQEGWLGGRRAFIMQPLGPGLCSGLANLSLFGQLSRLNGLQAGWMYQDGVNKVSCGNFCSPLCSPLYPARYGTKDSTGRRHENCPGRRS